MFQFSKSALLYVLFISASAFSSEIRYGLNELKCTEEEFGTFEIRFSITDKVLRTDYHTSKVDQQIPTWETMESQLNEIEFTSGKLLVPVGVKNALQGVQLKALRNVQNTPNKGKINIFISFPENSFLTESLSIYHIHQGKDETKLEARSYVWLDGSLEKFVFKCF